MKKNRNYTLKAKKTTARKTESKRKSLNMEALESRVMLSGVPAPTRVVRSVTFSDASFDLVNVSIRGPRGVGFTISLDGGASNNADIESLTLVGTNASTTLSITTSSCRFHLPDFVSASGAVLKGGWGYSPGVTEVGQITDVGTMGSIAGLAATFDNVNITGGLHSLATDVGKTQFYTYNGSNPNPLAKVGIGNVSVTGNLDILTIRGIPKSVGGTNDLTGQITVGGTLGLVNAAQSDVLAPITAGSIGNLTVHDIFANVSATGSIGPVKANNLNADLSAGTSLGNLALTGTLLGSARAGTTVGNISVDGNFTGLVQAGGSIGNLVINSGPAFTGTVQSTGGSIGNVLISRSTTALSGKLLAATSIGNLTAGSFVQADVEAGTSIGNLFSTNTSANASSGFLNSVFTASNGGIGTITSSASIVSSDFHATGGGIGNVKVTAGGITNSVFDKATTIGNVTSNLSISGSTFLATGAIGNITSTAGNIGGSMGVAAGLTQVLNAIGPILAGLLGGAGGGAGGSLVGPGADFIEGGSIGNILALGDIAGNQIISDTGGIGNITAQAGRIAFDSVLSATSIGNIEAHSNGASIVFDQNGTFILNSILNGGALSLSGAAIQDSTFTAANGAIGTIIATAGAFGSTVVVPGIALPVGIRGDAIDGSVFNATSAIGTINANSASGAAITDSAFKASAGTIASITAITSSINGDAAINDSDFSALNGIAIVGGITAKSLSEDGGAGINQGTFTVTGTGLAGVVLGNVVATSVSGDGITTSTFHTVSGDIGNVSGTSTQATGILNTNIIAEHSNIGQVTGISYSAEAKNEIGDGLDTVTIQAGSGLTGTGGIAGITGTAVNGDGMTNVSATAGSGGIGPIMGVSSGIGASHVSFDTLIYVDPTGDDTYAPGGAGVPPRITVDPTGDDYLVRGASGIDTSNFFTTGAITSISGTTASGLGGQLAGLSGVHVPPPPLTTSGGAGILSSKFSADGGIGTGNPLAVVGGTAGISGTTTSTSKFSAGIADSIFRAGAPGIGNVYASTAVVDAFGILGTSALNGGALTPITVLGCPPVSLPVLTTGSTIFSTLGSIGNVTVNHGSISGAIFLAGYDIGSDLTFDGLATGKDFVPASTVVSNIGNILVSNGNITNSAFLAGVSTSDTLLGNSDDALNGSPASSIGNITAQNNGLITNLVLESGSIGTLTAGQINGLNLVMFNPAASLGNVKVGVGANGTADVTPANIDDVSYPGLAALANAGFRVAGNIGNIDVANASLTGGDAILNSLFVAGYFNPTGNATIGNITAVTRGGGAALASAAASNNANANAIDGSCFVATGGIGAVLGAVINNDALNAGTAILNSTFMADSNDTGLATSTIKSVRAFSNGNAALNGSDAINGSMFLSAGGIGNGSPLANTGLLSGAAFPGGTSGILVEVGSTAGSQNGAPNGIEASAFVADLGPIGNIKVHSTALFGSGIVTSLFNGSSIGTTNIDPPGNEGIDRSIFHATGSSLADPNNGNIGNVTVNVGQAGATLNPSSPATGDDGIVGSTFLATGSIANVWAATFGGGADTNAAGSAAVQLFPAFDLTFTTAVGAGATLQSGIAFSSFTAGTTFGDMVGITHGGGDGINTVTVTAGGNIGSLIGAYTPFTGSTGVPPGIAPNPIGISGISALTATSTGGTIGFSINAGTNTAGTGFLAVNLPAADLAKFNGGLPGIVGYTDGFGSGIDGGSSFTASAAAGKINNVYGISTITNAVGISGIANSTFTAGTSIGDIVGLTNGTGDGMDTVTATTTTGDIGSIIGVESSTFGLSGIHTLTATAGGNIATAAVSAATTAILTANLGAADLAAVTPGLPGVFGLTNGFGNGIDPTVIKAGGNVGNVYGIATNAASLNGITTTTVTAGNNIGDVVGIAKGTGSGINTVTLTGDSDLSGGGDVGTVIGVATNGTGANGITGLTESGVHLGIAIAAASKAVLAANVPAAINTAILPGLPAAVFGFTNGANGAGSLGVTGATLTASVDVGNIYGIGNGAASSSGIFSTTIHANNNIGDILGISNGIGSGLVSVAAIADFDSSGAGNLGSVIGVSTNAVGVSGVVSSTLQGVNVGTTVSAAATAVRTANLSGAINATVTGLLGSGGVVGLSEGTAWGLRADGITSTTGAIGNIAGRDELAGATGGAGGILNVTATAGTSIGNITGTTTSAKVGAEGIMTSLFRAAGGSIGIVTATTADTSAVDTGGAAVIGGIVRSGFDAFGNIGAINVTGHLNQSEFVAGVNLGTDFTAPAAGITVVPFASATIGFGGVGTAADVAGAASTIGNITLTTVAGGAPAKINNGAFLSGVTADGGDGLIGNANDVVTAGSSIGNIVAPGGLDPVLVESGSIGTTTVTSGAIDTVTYLALDGTGAGNGIGNITVTDGVAGVTLTGFFNAINASNFVSSKSIGNVSATLLGVNTSANTDTGIGSSTFTAGTSIGGVSGTDSATGTLPGGTARDGMRFVTITAGTTIGAIAGVVNGGAEANISGGMFSVSVTAGGSITSITGTTTNAATFAADAGILDVTVRSGGDIGPITALISGTTAPNAINASGFDAFGKIGNIDATGNISGSEFIAGVNLGANFAVSGAGGPPSAAMGFDLPLPVNANTDTQNAAATSIGTITLHAVAGGGTGKINSSTFSAGLTSLGADNLIGGAGANADTNVAGSSIGNITAPGGIDPVYFQSGSIGTTTVANGAISGTTYVATDAGGTGIGAVNVTLGTAATALTTNGTVFGFSTTAAISNTSFTSAKNVGDIIGVLNGVTGAGLVDAGLAGVTVSAGTSVGQISGTDNSTGAASTTGRFGLWHDIVTAGTGGVSGGIGNITGLVTGTDAAITAGINHSAFDSGIGNIGIVDGETKNTGGGFGTGGITLSTFRANGNIGDITAKAGAVATQNGVAGSTFTASGNVATGAGINVTGNVASSQFLAGMYEAAVGVYGAGDAVTAGKSIGAVNIAGTFTGSDLIASVNHGANLHYGDTPGDVPTDDVSSGGTIGAVVITGSLGANGAASGLVNGIEAATLTSVTGSGFLITDPENGTLAGGTRVRQF